MEENKIITRKVDGVEKEIKIFYAFDSLDAEKSYVIYTDELESDDLKYIAVIDDDNNLVNTDDEKDIEIVDAYLRESLEAINDNIEV